jgi:hypothetical protein
MQPHAVVLMLFILALLDACTASPAPGSTSAPPVTPPLQSTFAPPNLTLVALPTLPPAPTQTPLRGDRQITQADNWQLLQVHVGATFTLDQAVLTNGALGIADQQIITLSHGTTFTAIAKGHTELMVTEGYTCSSTTPRCAPPKLRFLLNVQVQ